jgi:hypothetical protein
LQGTMISRKATSLINNANPDRKDSTDGPDFK